MRSPASWRAALLVGVAALLASACGGGGGPATGADTPVVATPADPDALRALLAQNQVVAPVRPVVSDALFNLGLNLFQSTLLSGNRQVSCASCHPIGNGGLDNFVLGIGVNGSGGPPGRTGTPVLHRNTPSLLDMTAVDRTAMFWDGRVALRDGVFTTPAGAQLPSGLTSAAAAQALFPLLARSEMLGEHDPTDGNPIADLNPPGTTVESNPKPVWNALMDRLRADTGFSAMLRAAYPELPLADIGIAHAANAIAAFEARRWYDFGSSNELHGYVAGTHEIGDSARRGGLLFFGAAGCARCHSGPLLSDQKFHNLAVPPIGPGFGSGAAETPPNDKGRYEVSGRSADRYAFLTPSLWEVKNTFPYLHDGVYSTLEQTLRHHLDAAASARAFRCPATPLVAGGNAIACNDITTAPALYADLLATLAPEMVVPVVLSEAQIADLIAFLNVLSDGNNTSTR